MKQLQTLSIVSPGFYGLNTQESGVTISNNFAYQADNVVIDKSGQLGSRQGWIMQTTLGETALTDNTIDFMLEHFNADDTVVTLSAGNNKIFKNGDNSSELVDITPVGYTPTLSHWSGATLYDHAILVQNENEPLIYTEASTPNLQTITTLTGVAQSWGTSYPKHVIGAYGRFWAHDGDTIYWSTDIADTAFPAFSGGTSGTLNIAAIVPNNVDKITALAAHNGFLIIFCEHSIVIYRGAENPLGDFSLSDVITGVGCVARNSIKNTGNDLIFLSDTGIRSLGRVIQEKSLPMRDLTKNVRDDLIANMKNERALHGDLDRVCAIYSELNAFYLLSLPSRKTVYCLDMRSALEDGASRVTKWTGFLATSFLRKRDRELLIGKTNGIGKYGGYTDNTQAYTMSYLSHHTDMSMPTTIKILKHFSATVFGGSGQQFVVKTNFNYNEDTRRYGYSIPEAQVAEFNISEFGVGEFSKGVLVENIKESVAGSGNVLQVGFEAVIKGASMTVQKIDMFVKTGRIS